MSGIHQYIKDLDPILLYTFDPLHSFVDLDSCTGVYINITETEFPPLELKNSGIYFKEPFLKFIMPSLSYIENNSTKKSFSTGYPKSISGSFKIPYEMYIRNYSFNNGSLYTIADLDESEYISFVDSPYTIFFQLKLTRINTVSQLLPHLLDADVIKTTSYFGIFSYFEFYNADLLNNKPANNYFGFESYALLYDEIINTNYFGYNVTADLQYNKFKTLNEIVFNMPQMVYIPDSSDVPEALYSPFGLDINYFRFRGCELNLLYNSIILENNNFVELEYDRIYNIFFEYAPDNRIIKLYVDKGIVGEISKKQFSDNILKIGYNSRLTPGRIENVPDAHQINTPTVNMHMDNFSIYPRYLSRAEKDRLYDINRDYPARFIEYGYTQLYTFEHFHDSKSQRYIENETQIPNIYGHSYLYAYTSNTLTVDTLPYVYRQNDTEIEYVYHNSKYSCLGSKRNDYNFYDSMFRSESKTISFRFKTSDRNGALFTIGHQEHRSFNIGLLMNGGSLEIRCGDILRKSLTGIANGEWHSVFIVYDSVDIHTRIKIYIDDEIYVNHVNGGQNTPPLQAEVKFGTNLPGLSLECDYAMIGISEAALSHLNIVNLKQNTTLYEARGQVTINNVQIGTKIFIYDRATGNLIDTLYSDDVNGVFKYVNRTPYVLTIIVTDSGYLNGRSYIVDPIEIK
jgi:hypothetical protein